MGQEGDVGWGEEGVGGTTSPAFNDGHVFVLLDLPLKFAGTDKPPSKIIFSIIHTKSYSLLCKEPLIP